MNLTKSDYAVYVGRFQPFHNGHKFVIEEGLKHAKKVVILCGSANSAKSERNPWNYEERKHCIENSFPGILKDNLIIFPLNDHKNDQDWKQEVRKIVAKISNKKDKIILIGHYKDSSSYYLKLFPDWQLLQVDNFQNINATDIRKTIENTPSVAKLREYLVALVPKNVLVFLIEFFQKNKNR